MCNPARQGAGSEKKVLITGGVAAGLINEAVVLGF
ncbi:MAG: hypothetical protein CM15mP46_5220 [Alphaproteobacteria bacterium]|nr:MAG: hypothetical protein CM15mP46_5220 [Alphaproteobacteria bacterium]